MRWRYSGKGSILHWERRDKSSVYSLKLRKFRYRTSAFPFPFLVSPTVNKYISNFWLNRHTHCAKSNGILHTQTHTKQLQQLWLLLVLRDHWRVTQLLKKVTVSLLETINILQAITKTNYMSKRWVLNINYVFTCKACNKFPVSYLNIHEYY